MSRFIDPKDWSEEWMRKTFKGQCGACRWFDASFAMTETDADVPRSHCRINPPAVLPIGEGRDTTCNAWPLVSCDDWCGKFDEASK